MLSTVHFLLSGRIHFFPLISHDTLQADFFRSILGMRKEQHEWF